MSDSPFLPGTKVQFAWDSTSLGYLKTCPRLYQYIMLEGWSPRDESIHLRFGIEYHAALEMYDHSRASGVGHDDSVHDVVREVLFRVEDWDPDPSTKAGSFKHRESLLRTVVWYLDQYQDDNAKTVELNNGKPAVEQSFRFELDYGPAGPGGANEEPYILCGHLDKVVEYGGEVFAMDHKTTTSSLTDYYWNQFEPNNQMTLYSLAAKVILHAPVKGVIIDAVQIAQSGVKFERRFTYRTPDQLEEWLNDLRHWLRLAERYAEDGYWPQNDTACDKFGGCRFRQICSKSPNVRSRFLAAKFTQLPEEERWNPLQTR